MGDDMGAVWLAAHFPRPPSTDGRLAGAPRPRRAGESDNRGAGAGNVRLGYEPAPRSRRPELPSGCARHGRLRAGRLLEALATPGFPRR